MNDAEHFEVYGAAAEALTDPTVRAGRHSFQRDAERLIADDVAAKLRLDRSDRLLEIGCGLGNVLRPLAPLVAEAIGVDHPSVVGAFDPVPGNVALVAGNWPDVALDGDFDKVFAYSVLHCLSDRVRALDFVDAALAVVRRGGLLLLGDLPNGDAAARFAGTEYGQRFLEEWGRTVAAQKSDDDEARDRLWADAPKLDRFIDDAFVAEVFSRYRGQGHEVYVLPQPPGLPFSQTREDVLIRVRP
jgi:cyclopropane fatty-acyl-phospholipid synthase-like methyltransferase